MLLSDGRFENNIARSYSAPNPTPDVDAPGGSIGKVFDVDDVRFRANAEENV